MTSFSGPMFLTLSVSGVVAALDTILNASFPTLIHRFLYASSGCAFAMSVTTLVSLALAAAAVTIRPRIAFIGRSSK